ncbi:hypothetical protein VB776_05965 [Arcicella sp. DC2W]|uniref:Prevent-host-death protein n=1 Tax=Arcicella gelida TaxID=2984195 RepID=A0ABU5S1Y5_9BACT|nr:hypothetical protein [Arcicella sp. DC2W]MEA5402450.1 hypothetical protein [Arcicella sp. DC2W]
MALQYLSDPHGKTTAVVIPIKIWEIITDKHQDLKKLEGAFTQNKEIEPLEDIEKSFKEMQRVKKGKLLKKTFVDSFHK